VKCGSKKIFQFFLSEQRKREKKEGIIYSERQIRDNNKSPSNKKEENVRKYKYQIGLFGLAVYTAAALGA